MRRLLMLVPVAVGAVTLAGAALVPAGAGDGGTIGVAPLTIEKEVDGRVPDDTEFTVTVNCSGPIIFTGPNAPNASSAKVDFDNEGDPDGSNVLTFDRAGTCTVTETEDGDAEDVSYECEGQSGQPNTTGSEFGDPAPAAPAPPFDPCVTHGPQDDPIHVLIQREDQSATVTVTNEFPDPEKPAAAPAAQPVAVSPTFTG